MSNATWTAFSDPCGRVWIEQTKDDVQHLIHVGQSRSKSGIKELLAIARPMAAAQELVEALEAAVPVLDHDHYQDRHRRDSELYELSQRDERVREQVRAAIAKAKGEGE